MRDVQFTEDAAIAVRDGRIAECGSRTSVESKHSGRKVSLGDRIVVPAFTDCHSHALFAGSREKDLIRKLRGDSYLDILKGGGGILYTLAKTREAGEEQLISETLPRLHGMLAGGMTCVEVKSGYGLSLEHELKMLRAAGRLSSPRQTIVPTYLGAHAFPPGTGRSDYISEIIHSQLPAVKRSGLSSICDVFIEDGAFTPEEGLRILASAGKLGFRLTAHIDEFTCTGAAEGIAALGAVSVSHLAHTPRNSFQALASSGTIGIILPSTPLFSMSRRFPDGASMISAGMPVAIGTDLSPNSWNESMMLSCILAVYECGMTQEEVLTAATLNSSCAVGMSEELGSIEKGKKADFICLDIDGPGKIFYRNSDNIVNSVFSSGVEVYRSQA
jgi:imidazolonepropionase